MYVEFCCCFLRKLKIFSNMLQNGYVYFWDVRGYFYSELNKKKLLERPILQRNNYLIITLYPMAYSLM